MAKVSSMKSVRQQQTADTAAALPTVRLTNITKLFSSVAALSDVSVDIHAGEVHAILGENGAGKSTLINIIAGVLQPDLGSIAFDGQLINLMTPEKSAAMGVAISYQHPAILDDLSVLENLRVALPARVFSDGKPANIARAILDDVGLNVSVNARADSLTVAQKHLLEIAKALAMRPSVLILDEPTATLDQDSTEMLFARIRSVVEAGTAVIYITHRLAELRQIAHRVTVLRDGRVKGSALVSEVSDDDLLGMIVGRSLASTFPPKSSEARPEINLSVTGLTGSKFRDVSFAIGRGQIIGLAGVEGNGQHAVMRALAGLEPWTGEVRLNNKSLSFAELKTKSAYMPSDRHTEGIIMDLTVRENATFSTLARFSRFGLMDRLKEIAEVNSVFGSLAVKTPSLDAGIMSLSGGNQQKVVMSRALMSRPGFILADEPTQGVDVGARFEIYRILREVSQSGTPVIVNSSDAAELEGLCDVVIVMSRGQVVETLVDADVNEERIVAAAVQAQSHIAGPAKILQPVKTADSGLRRLIQSDNATVLPLAIVIVALALYVFGQNHNYLSAFNISNILLLATALGFIAMGQTIALLMGGIDLSVGPLAGFLVVVASFFINDGQSVAIIALGFGLIFGVAIVVGSINGCLIRYAKFTPIAATLAMYIGLQGLSFVLREGPDGYINFAIMDFMTWKFGPLPAAFIAMVLIALGAEYVLRSSKLGWQLRAVGSHEESARRICIRVNRVIIGGYIAVALFTALGAIMLMVQIGVGDPSQGINYTLGSITAVVLGGTSLRGGRGTFIGTVMGAVLLTEVLNAVSFLGLSQTYQYIFQGVLILAAAVIYTSARRRVEP
jgi:ribose transport system ATP-binding protein